MIIVMMYILMVVGVAYLAFQYYKSHSHDKSCYEYRWKAVTNVCVTGFLFGAVVFGIFIGESYHTYLVLKGKQVTIEQNKQALDLYADRLNSQAFSDGALTDMKYNQYQLSLKDLIETYRDQVMSYNKGIVSKRTMGNNWFFKGLIVLPDADMQPISML